MPTHWRSIQLELLQKALEERYPWHEVKYGRVCRVFLHLAQLDLLHEKSNRQAIVLCDDLTSELDTEHSQQLVQQLVDLKGQIFVTGVDLSVLQTQKHERFHMINGDAEKVV